MTGRIRGRDSWKTAAEVVHDLAQDPAFVARQKEQEEQRLRNAECYRLSARAVLAELASLGWKVAAVGELRGLGKPYPDAVPVLVRWMFKVKDAAVREDIVRTLSVPWASAAATALVEAFERLDDAVDDGLRWVIGNALEVLARDEIADGLIRLATDRRFGLARQMVVLGLGKLDDPRVVDVLVGLLDDDDVMIPAIASLGKLRATAARPRLEPLLEHPKAAVRKEAKKAIARIDKPRAPKGRRPR